MRLGEDSARGLWGPELFDACGHRIVLERGAGLAAALEQTDLDPEARAALRRKLRIE